MSIKVGILSAVLTFNCVSTKLVHLQTEFEEETAVNICFDEKKELFFSKICLDSNCIESVAEKTKNKKFRLDEFSSPSFAVCRGIDGAPELASVTIEGKEYDVDICNVDKTGSFISSAVLFQTFLKPSPQ